MPDGLTKEDQVQLAVDLDEVFIKINGNRMYLWRAVDDEGEVLEVLVQSRRNKKAALKLARKLLKKTGLSTVRHCNRWTSSIRHCIEGVGFIQAPRLWRQKEQSR